MAHTTRCGRAKTARSRCKCSCNGDLHGPRADGARSASATIAGDQAVATNFYPSKVHARNRRGKVMSRAEAELDGWLATALASPPDNSTAVIAQTVDMVSDSVASAVIDVLSHNGYDVQGVGHIVCGFLAAAVRTMQQFQDKFNHAVTQMVSTILESRKRDHHVAIPEPLVKIAAQATVNVLTELSISQHFDNLIRAVRIAAVMMCPAPEQHEVVVRYCLSPLENDVLSDGVKQDLTSSLPKGWMGSIAVQ